MEITPFLHEIEVLLRRSDVTEHSYRPLLKTLVETLMPGVTALNEPRRADYGAPDFVITQGATPIGHIEAKDIGQPLARDIRDSERSQPRTGNAKQLQRYRAALPNLLYTDGLEWYWFVNGEQRGDAVVLATWNKSTARITPASPGATDLQQLLEQFHQHNGPTIARPRELAERLAQIAHWLRDVIDQVFQGPPGSLHQQYEAFKQMLLPGLTTTEFADMYAQTIVYGLFAARVASPGASSFTRLDAARNIPLTNPFLRTMFQQIAGYDLDDRVAWLVDDCAVLLAHTDMTEVMRDFGHATRQQDPVVHFYETFLAVYDPKLREARGVYYTPEPVVSFVVHSIHTILQRDFGKSLGLADRETIILDPATGTATFLNAVIQQIHRELVDQGMAGTWDGYVSEHLLRRMFGFELLMAPYTIAHLKLGLLLAELGYTFHSNERLGVYLTNTLADAPASQQAFAFAQNIAAEGQAADAVKHNKDVMIVLGNPPYSGHSANTGSWITDLLRGQLPDGTRTASYYAVDGQPLGERNSKWLQDDYVKFIRFGQWRISQTGEGVLAYISNNGYLDNPTFRGMRQSLLDDFDTIYILNLHGNSKKKERAPDGSADANVFDIQQGVAIGIFVKQRTPASAPAQVFYADLWGRREDKYAALAAHDITTVQWQQLQPASPWYLFVPQNLDLRAEYTKGWNIVDVMAINTVGVVTGQDKNTISFTIQEGGYLADQQNISHTVLRSIMYRPFDIRFIVYDKSVITRPRLEVMPHMIENNLGMIVSRQTRDHWSVLATNILIGHKACAAYDINYIFPLYLYPDPDTDEPTLFDGEPASTPGGRRPNLAPAFTVEFAQHLGLDFIEDGRGDLQATFGPEDVFHYIYAIFHSPTYRERYAEFLKIDFPRLPLPSDSDRFRALAGLGAQLVDLHLLRLPGVGGVGGAGGAIVLQRPGQQGLSFPIGGTNEVENPRYSAPEETRAGRVFINTTQYIEGIDPTTWAMQIGGYQPLEKWLKDRKGRMLSFDDVQHYLRTAIALRETARLMQQIEAAMGE